MESSTAASSDVGRFRTYVLVFVASFCLMVIELVAGRIMAPYLGSSLYTWTSVIGVVLTGVTVGNYVGGVLAERGATWRTLAFVFVFSGFAAAASFYVYAPVADTVQSLELPIQAATLFFALMAFFPVSFLLSTVTPIVITLTLSSLNKTGTTVGKIYAVSAFASIMGTFASGFLLIPLLGVRTIVLSVSGILLLTGIISSRGVVAREKAVKATLVLLWLSLLAPKFCTAETAYYCIRLEPSISDRGEGYRLVLDRLTHSFVYGNPHVLEYDYEVTYAVAAEYQSRRLGGMQPLRTLSIGGGGYTMPKFIVENYPDAEVEVVEIDPGVTGINQRLLGLNPESPILTFNEDARMYLAAASAESRYDIVFGDAFNDYSVPYHLTTLEFARMVRSHLAPGGIYALNIIDNAADGRLLSSFVRTLGGVFGHVEVASMGPGWNRDGRNTFVIIASDEPVNRGEWRAAAEAAYARTVAAPQTISIDDVTYLVPEAERLALGARKGGVTLTDDYAPVDSLTAPLF